MSLEITTVITGAGALVAGLALDYFKQWGAHLFAAGEIRRAIRAEMRGVIVTLNFRLLEACSLASSGKDADAVAACFRGLSGLKSIDYYVTQKRDLFLKLAEWPVLERWNERLARVAEGPEHPLFNVVMLFESFNVNPGLMRYLDRGTRRFVKQIIERPEVQQIQSGYLRQRFDGGC